MKGVFNNRPPKRKFGYVWDVKILFDYFQRIGDNSTLSDEQLTYKLLILLLLLGGQRINTIFWFHIDELIINDISATFAPSHVLKHSRDHRRQDIFEYRSYPDKTLCAIDCLQTYIKRRQGRAPEDMKKLFITIKKPYKEASTDTLRRWVKTLFNITGIFDFSPHSCRSAASSKASVIGVNIDNILKKGCWSNIRTFHNYYEKEILDYAMEEPFNKLLD